MKEKHQLDPKKKNILFVAENPHDTRKGFSLLMEALTAFNTDDFEVSVIGNEAYVQNAIIKANFFGTVNDEQKMVELYNAADVFVIPSLEDNLPNTVSEALLCGTAVSGMRIGGIQEMVQDGINGYLSTEGNGLGAAIAATLQHNFKSEDIRQQALKELDEQKLISDFKAMYTALI